MRLRAAVLLSLLGFATSTVARANDGVSPRTPVVWDEATCMLEVDRSVQPLLHLPYSIPYEDTELTPHEVPGSRTHQFFALCRHSDPLVRLPTWISWADVEVARQAKLVLDSETIDPEEVLESSTAWSGCWLRITEDDDRRPITFEAAEAGVEWDTSAIPAGAYAVAGYTHHPRFNQWSPRPGVVKVHDGDPDAIGPAIAVTTGELITSVGRTVTIDGCVNAPAGTTLTALHAEASAGGSPQWVAFVEAQPVDDDTFAVDLTVPETLAGTTVMVRVDATDPSGKTSTTHMSGFVVVLETEPSGCDDPPCDVTDSTGTDDESDPTDAPSTSGQASDDSSGPAPEQGDEPRGCGCTALPPTRTGWLMPALLLLVRQRRERSARCRQ